MAIDTVTSQIYIKCDGNDIIQSQLAMIVNLSIEQQANLPNTSIIHFKDSDLDLLDKGHFDLTKKIEIEAELSEGDKYLIFQGEITSLEPSFDDNMISSLLVRGYDQSHRLYREQKSKAFLNQTDSDLAKQIAQEHGLDSDIESTATVYDHIYQDNLSNLAFLQQRARRIGFECFVTEETLHFHSPKLQEPSGITLTWGQDLISFHPRMSLAEQVESVEVRGWDVDKQTAIIGQAKQGGLYPRIEESKNGAEWAKAFSPGKHVVVNQPIINQAEADILAKARLDEISGRFITATGVAYRRPDIRAGQVITLDALGERFSGDYLVTSTKHVYNEAGWRTQFTVSGLNSGLLTTQIKPPPSRRTWTGVVTAVVTNTDDPNSWGRVKVKFPWMSDEAESEWARVSSPGAGPAAGFYAVPDVGHEVLVAFEHGDISRPYILGGMWNGQHNLPPEVSVKSGEAPQVRSWQSLHGHHITLYDNDNKKIEIVTEGGHQIVISDSDGKLEIATAGGHKMMLDDHGSKITVESNGDLEIKSAKNITIEASAKMELKAQSINLSSKQITAG